MSFYVQFLGTGSALPKENAHPSAQYVFCQNRHFLIDCGEGTQVQFRRFGIKIQKLDAVFISHLHGDHYFGLVGLLSSMHLLGRKKAIKIYAPPPLEGIVRSQLEVGGARLDFEIHFHNIENDFEGILFQDKVLTINTFKLKHKIPTHGFRFDENPKSRHLLGDKYKSDGLSIVHIQTLKDGLDAIDENGRQISFEEYTTPADKSGSYAYCSDTGYSEQIVPWIQNVQVLYHEATFTAQEADRAKSTKHSTAGQAGKIAHLAKVGQLFIGHLSARYENPAKHLLEAGLEFENVKYAVEGEIVRIN